MLMPFLTMVTILWTFFVMDEMDFKIFGPYVGMKPGHLKRLQEAVFSMKRRGDV